MLPLLKLFLASRPVSVKPELRVINIPPDKDSIRIFNLIDLGLGCSWPNL